MLMKKIGWFLLIILVLLCGCSGGGGQETSVSANTGFVPATPGNYDSADTAIVISKNTEEQTITFQNAEFGKRYTLHYDGATTYADKYGQPMSLQQIEEGQLVYVTFMKEWKRCNSIAVSGDAFLYREVDDFLLSDNASKMMLDGEEYSLDRNLVVLTPEGEGELMDVNAVDVLQIVGRDHVIYSICVSRGHGYLRLVNDSFFVGGWIEISPTQIYPIEEDMLLAVPEGSYPVTVSGRGCSGTETVQIVRGQEYEMDVSRWQSEAQYGELIFTVTPDTARVYIDGEVIDVSESQELEYGIHQMIVVASGYQTITKYIRVGSEMANLDIVMEPEEEESVSANETASSNTASSNSASQNTVSENSGGTVTVTVPGENGQGTGTTISPAGANTSSGGGSASGNTAAGTSGTVSGNGSSQVISPSSGYRVYIEAPVGAEVYVDGSYVGIAPISFPKGEGSYVITLRQDGYQTRSYTITPDSGNRDVNYSFSALTAIP
ncbi:MAG: PEGA domain-containing protein [Lachnospiraceae bacterium]|nr:PEGA domain-containing protein [Lachnospiraceae bacterium]